MERFVKQLLDVKTKSVFAVCTCNWSTGVAFRMLRKALKRVGGRLAAGFAVQMPNSHIVGGNPEAVEEQEKMFQRWKSKRDGLIEQISEKKEGVFKKFVDARRSELKMVNFILSFEFVVRMVSIRYSSNDEWFYVNTNCNACGACVDICAAKNIEMLEGKPYWRRMSHGG